MKKHGHDPVPLGDIQNEIFDMVKPEHPHKISLNDLIRCGQGEVVVNILIDLIGFWTHENRESSSSEQSSSSSGMGSASSNTNGTTAQSAHGNQSANDNELIKDDDKDELVDIHQDPSEQVSSQV